MVKKNRKKLILDTDVSYVVDRILRQQKAERQAIDVAKKKVALLSAPSPNIVDSSPVTPITPSSAQSNEDTSTPIINHAPPPNKNPFKTFKKKIGSSTSTKIPPLIPPVPQPITRGPNTGSHVTPLRNISKKKPTTVYNLDS